MRKYFSKQGGRHKSEFADQVMPANHRRGHGSRKEFLKVGFHQVCRKPGEGLCFFMMPFAFAVCNGMAQQVRGEMTAF